MQLLGWGNHILIYYNNALICFKRIFYKKFQASDAILFKSDKITAGDSSQKEFPYCLRRPQGHSTSSGVQQVKQVKQVRGVSFTLRYKVTDLPLGLFGDNIVLISEGCCGRRQQP